ncbi:MAG: peptide-methionine (S)-S-oxide reductase MsrA [Bdellovibrionales bacterium]
MKELLLLTVFAVVCFGFLIFMGGKSGAGLLDKGEDLMTDKPSGYPVAVFAGGCFWCTESEFRGLDGVLYTRAGYTGGHLDNPKYEDTHGSKSGHAEAIEVTYDPDKVTYRQLVAFFLKEAHDPTQLNRQGPDVGTQYRSAIFYADEAEKEIAQDVIAEVNAAKIWDKPIVTTLEPAATFWQAEDYHQQYFEKYKAKNGVDHINVILKKGGLK